MDSREILLMYRGKIGMSRKEFCLYFEIPYRTVQDWELGNRKMPDYLLRLMAYKIKMEKLDNWADFPMKEGQEKFYCFIMLIAKESRRRKADAILRQCFEAQNEGKLDKAYLDEVMPELVACVKPEDLPKLREAMEHFL